MRRHRKAKILATIGPATQSFEMIQELYLKGADVFRLNFSHGTHAIHAQTVAHIRRLEEMMHVPMMILADLQGPKLRIGTFKGGSIQLKTDDIFILDMQDQAGDHTRVMLPHPEIMAAISIGDLLLLDDGKMRLKVEKKESERIITRVIIGGTLSDRKGVNVPEVDLPISALTAKDHRDLKFALELGIDGIALSFVQRPEDIQEARALIGHSAYIVAKIEKPRAMHHLHEIIALCDGILVARGDLGVELSPEEVPVAQKRIVRLCRESGKPVIVATQMLESMIYNASPTRAEASDVATAIYDGVDAVMLSAETATGQYPAEAVDMMERIITQIEKDPIYEDFLSFQTPSIRQTTNDAMTAAARYVAQTISVEAIVTFTETGGTTLREARERPAAPIIGLTPSLQVARMLQLVWGTHPILAPTISSFSEMVSTACRLVIEHHIAQQDDKIIILAGVPFGQRSGTNVLRIVEITSQHYEKTPYQLHHSHEKNKGK